MEIEAAIKEIHNYVERRAEQGNAYVKASHVEEHTPLSAQRAGKLMVRFEDAGYLERWGRNANGIVWKIVTDEYDLPDIDDLERVPADEYHDDCDCMERDGDA